VSATSSGYIDPRDVATIQQAQVHTAIAEGLAPSDEEETLENVSSMSLAKGKNGA